MVKGGGEIRDIRVAEGLRERGHEVKFITGKPLIGEVRFNIRSFETFYVLSPYLHYLSNKLPNDIKEKLKIKGATRRIDDFTFRRSVLLKVKRKIINSDVVHLFGLGMAPLAQKIEKLGTKSILLLTSDSSLYRYSKEIQNISGVIAVGRTKIHVPNEANCIEINEPIPEKFRPRKVPREIKINNNKVSTKKSNILYAGRLIKKKRIMPILDALEILNSKKGSFQLLIAGEGPRKDKIIEEARKKSLKSEVKLLGSIENKEMPKIYNASDVLVLLSERESFSMVAVEALSCGVPIVSTRVGIVTELVEDGRNGFLINEIRPEEISNKIAKCVQSREIKDTTKKSSKKVSKKFCSGRIIDRIEDFLGGIKEN